MKKENKEESIFKTHFVFKFDIFPIELIVSVGYSKEELKNKNLPSLQEIDFDSFGKLNENSDGKFVGFQDGSALIMMRDFNSRSSGSCFSVSRTIVHECTHYVLFVFERIGMKMNSETEELFAYMMERVVSELTNKISDEYKKFKKSDIRDIL